MHTNQKPVESARRFRRSVKGELAARGLSVTALSRQICKSRNAVSRAINRSEFPKVQQLIRAVLHLP